MTRRARIPWLKDEEKVTVYLLNGQYSTKRSAPPKGYNGWILIHDHASGFLATFNAKIFWTATKPTLGGLIRGSRKRDK